MATEGSVNVVITAETAIELVPVMRERLADLETPVSAFAKLRVLGGAFLFEPGSETLADVFLEGFERSCGFDGRSN